MSMPSSNSDKSTTEANDPGDLKRSLRSKPVTSSTWDPISNRYLLGLSAVVGIFVLALATSVLPTKKPARISDELALRLQSFGIPVSPSSVPTTYAVVSGANYAVASAVQEKRNADTTAILLNWSRLENVLLISSLFCGPWLDDTIAEVFIWNNNPNLTLTTETFRETGCVAGKLRIHNSPLNKLFQARHLACEEARTPYCFTQDDDYLVQPEVIKNMRTYVLQNPATRSLHLLPAHEHLLSRLRTFVSEDGFIRTTFSWLGYGTYLSRSSVKEFLHLLHALNVSDEEMKMADNYFTILANRPKVGEIWFDHGIELGGGQPFTVGSEGDDRNDGHIVHALEYLSLLSSGQHPASSHPYLSKSGGLEIQNRVNFAPCRVNPCIAMSNIELLPGASQYDFRGIDMESVTRRKLSNLNTAEKEWYIQYPLSSIVDGRPRTTFRSLDAAKTGDWIVLDALGVLEIGDRSLELSFLVAEDMEAMFREDCSFGTSIDGRVWMDNGNTLTCSQVHEEDVPQPLIECSIKVATDARYFRVMVSRLNHVDHARWTVHEIWLRYVRSDL